MLADAAAAAVVGIVAVIALAGVVLCYLAQRQGRKAEYEIESPICRFHYRCDPLRAAPTAQPRTVADDATGETIGAHHALSTSDASAASRASSLERLGSKPT